MSHASDFFRIEVSTDECRDRCLYADTVVLLNETLPCQQLRNRCSFKNRETVNGHERKLPQIGKSDVTMGSFLSEAGPVSSSNLESSS